MKCRYILLALSCVAPAAGFSHARPGVVFDLGHPLGATLFGLFLIPLVLGQATALYDKQTRPLELAWKPGEIRLQPLSILQEVAHDPAHTMASPH
jgi:hypothetical protein